MFEFVSNGDVPMVAKFHPITTNLIVGYVSGIVGCIDLISGSILSQHKYLSITHSFFIVTLY